jgi:type I restriction enzyme S subunit
MLNKVNLPQGWKLVLLDSVAKRGSGHTPAKSVPAYWNGGIKWISLADSNKLDKIHISSTKYEISKEGIKNSSAVLHPPGVVVVSRDAGVGKSAITTCEMAVSQHFIAWECGPEIHNYFLYYWLQFMKPVFEKIAIGSTIKTIGLPFFQKLEIPLPPINTQHVIAEILLCWDSGIHELDQLLKAKITLKRALEQQLLTGKQRFEEFAGQEWKEVQLGEIFKEVSDTNDRDNGHSIMTISARSGLISQEDKFDRVIAGNSLTKYTQIKRGDFAYNKGNSKSYQMGCIYQLEDRESALVPFVYICFRATGAVYSSFYKHWFLAHGLDRQLKKIITSGARSDGLLNVNTDDFFKLKVPLPPTSEQKAIAHVFEALSKEISLLEKTLDAFKRQKRGLMQKLLTGKIRVKTENRSRNKEELVSA